MSAYEIAEWLRDEMEAERFGDEGRACPTLKRCSNPECGCHAAYYGGPLCDLNHGGRPCPDPKCHLKGER